MFNSLREGILFNSSARIEINDGSDPKVTEEFMTRGNVTEQGLFKFLMNSMGGQACIDLRQTLAKENTL